MQETLEQLTATRRGKKDISMRLREVLYSAVLLLYSAVYILVWSFEISENILRNQT